jgi:hypothetical protein
MTSLETENARGLLKGERGNGTQASRYSTDRALFMAWFFRYD